MALSSSVLDGLIRECARVPEPVCVSFSGGRTSAMMLWAFAMAWGTTRGSRVVTFANTGREMPETLEFVRECGERWGIEIVWLERDPERSSKLKRVDYRTAARNGEPFERLVTDRRMVPNPVHRFCTQELKVRVMRNWCRDVLKWKRWHVALGIRADEAGRAVKLLRCNENPHERFRHALPMYHANVTREHVLEFWRGQPFDLELESDEAGRTLAGNCDLCFLKRAGDIVRLTHRYPERAAWWIAQENRFPGKHGVFRSDRPTYAELAKERNPDDQYDLFGLACHCTD